MTKSIPSVAADFGRQLAAPVDIGDTTFTLNSLLDADGVALVDAELYGFTIDSGAKKEYVVATLSTGVFTGVKSISRQGAVTTGFAIVHRVGVPAQITNHAALYRVIATLLGTIDLDAGVALKYDGAPAQTDPNALATIQFVLDTSAGVPVTFNATTVAGSVGENVTSGDWVYFKETDGLWYKTDADDTAKSVNVKLGKVRATTTSGNSVVGGIFVDGQETVATYVAGTVYYLSNTAGALATSAGTNSVIVGVGDDGGDLVFINNFPKELTANQLAALAGTLGTPSATNLFVTDENLSQASTDQSQLTQDSSSVVGVADTTGLRNKLAQSFIPSRTKIRGVNLYKSADTGTFTGTVTVALQADTAGSPSGSTLASVTITNAQWLVLLSGSVECLFASEYASLTVGSLYWIVVSTSTSDTSNHPNLGINTVGGYTSGSVKYNNTTDGWVAVSTIDLYFATLEGDASQVVQTNSSGVIPTPFYDMAALGMNSIVGAVSNTFAKTYFNVHLLFTLWTGSTSGAATTDFTNWTKSGNVTVNPMGLNIIFTSTGDALMTLDNVFYPGATATVLRYETHTNTIILDFWYKYVSGTGEAQMGFFSAPEGVYGDNATGVGFHVANGVLYALTQKADPNGQEVRTAITGITLTRWNNLRVEYDMGTSSNQARFYVNGSLKNTISGTGQASDSLPVSGNVFVGFGRDTTNPVLMGVTAPYFSIEMNP